MPNQVKEKIPGLNIRRNKNGFCVVRLHYLAHPGKRSPEWKETTRRGYSSHQWDAEYEIKWDVQTGKAVYPDFSANAHIRQLQAQKGKPLLRGWDFGYRRPACLISQVNDRDKWCWLKEIISENETIEDFSQRVIAICRDKFHKFDFEDFCDPAGAQHSDLSVSTSVEALNSKDIFPIYQASFIDDGLDLIRQKLLIQPDGDPGLLVSEEGCPIVVAGFRGGYHYPEPSTSNPEPKNPAKDGLYEHIMDAGRYIAINALQGQPIGDLGKEVPYVAESETTGY